MDSQDVARKNGWPVLISAANAVTSMGCPSEGAKRVFPAIFAEKPWDGEERS
jgi:hypothetical protein